MDPVIINDTLFLAEYYLLFIKSQMDQIGKVEAVIEQAEIRSTVDQLNKLERLKQNKDELLSYVRDNIIGSHKEYLIKTVYGEKPLVYADYTASGRSLGFIESYL